MEDNIVDNRSHVRNVINDEDIQMNEDDRSPAQGVINNRNITIISDNERDIKRALEDIYQWFGCAAHHINLVIKEGF